MLFRKVVVLLTLICGSLPAFSKDVTDQFNVYKNSEGSILLDGISDDSNLPLGDQASWLNTATLQEKYQLNSQYDNYILSISSVNAEVSNASAIPIDYLAVEVYQVFEGEFDGLPGVDFFVWVEGLGGLLFTPQADLAVFPLDVSELNGQLDLTKLGLTVYLNDINGDGIDDISIVDDESSYQFLGDGNGFSAGASVNNSHMVAEIPAKLSVSSSGALTYQVPIEVPAGINGLQPNISLNYNSRSGNGVVGVGWSIGGLDMFHRCGSDYVHDKKVKPIVLTDEDNICFNGQRVFGDRTELDYFNDIKEISGGYEVRTKGGLVKAYTHAVELGGTEYQWLVKSIKDRFNNEITYEYENLNGIAYLESIEYSGGKVVFIYDDTRADSVVKYVVGNKVSIEKLLVNIDVYTSGSTFKAAEYYLEYSSKIYENSNQELLDKISYCAFRVNNKVCAPSILFGKKQINELYSAENSIWSSSGLLLDSKILDWNGDGLSDLLISSRNGVEIQLNNEDLVVEKELIFLFDEFKTASSFVSADFNNDGSDSVVYRKISYGRTGGGDTNQHEQRHQWVLQTRGRSDYIPVTDEYKIFSKEVTKNNVTNKYFKPGMNPFSSPSPLVIDLNGDGFKDLIVPENDSWVVKINGINNKYKSVDDELVDGSFDHSFVTSEKLGYIKDISSISYAGRGLNGEVMLYFYGTSESPINNKYALIILNDAYEIIKTIDTGVSTERSLLADVNGDSLVDIVTVDGAGLKNNQLISLYLNNGGGVEKEIKTNLSALEVLPFGSMMFPLAKPSNVADINNDGLSDIIYFSNGGYECLISTGKGFVKKPLNIFHQNSFDDMELPDLKSGCEAVYQKLGRVKSIVNRVVSRYQDHLTVSYASLEASLSNIEKHVAKVIEQSSDVKQLLDEIEGGKGLIQLIQDHGCSQCSADNLESAAKALGSYLEILKLTVNTYNSTLSNTENISEDLLHYNRIYYALLNLTVGQIWSGDTGGESVVSALKSSLCINENKSIASGVLFGDKYHLADFTGDGVIDLLQVSGDNYGEWTVWKNNQNLQIDSISTAVEAGDVKSALNKDVSIKYTTQALASNYSKAAGTRSLHMKDLTQPISIVSDVIVQDKVGEKTLTHSSYAYEGFKYHTQGRGFLGASKHTVENIIAGTKSIVSFHQEFPYAGLKKKIETYIAGSKPILVTRSEFDWGNKTTAVDVLDGTNAIQRNRYTPLMQASLKLAYGLSANLISNKTVEYTSYDDYGNNLNNLTKLWDTDDFIVTGIPVVGYLHSEEINNIYPIDTENWLISNKSNSSRSVTGLNSNGQDLSLRDTSSRVINSAHQYYPNSLALKSTLTNLDATNSFTNWSYKNENGVVSDSGSSGTNFTSERLVVNEFLNNQYPTEIRSYGYNATKFIKYDPVLFKPTQITDFDGKTSHIDYDAFGREIETISGDGIVTTTRYISCKGDACQLSPEASYKVTVDSGGLPSSEIYYDKLNREILSRTQLQFEQHWQSVKTEYTPEGYLSRTSLPYLGTSPTHWTTYTNYDALGRVGLITRPDGGRIATDYSSVGGQQRIQVTETIKSADGASSTRVVQSFIDARGLLVKKIEAVGTAEQITVEFDYDAMGNRDWVQVGGNEKETTTSIFDNAGNLVQLNDPSTNISHYTYAANGDLLTLEDAKKQLLTYTYDLFSRPKSRQEGTGSRAKKTYWYYDNNSSCYDTNAPQTYQTYVGKICREYSIHDYASKYYRYDSRGNLAHTKSLVDNKISNYHARYDKYNRLESEKLDSGITLNYNYQKGYLNAILHQEKPLWEASKEDEFGNVTAYNLGNALKGLNSYDPQSGRLAGLSVGLGDSANSIQSNEYKWNSDGTLQSRIWQKPTAQTETFGYDAQKRLTEVTSKNVTRYSRNYGYELNGNIKSKTEIAGDLVYGGNNAGPYAVSSAGDVSYHYDDNGNITLRDPDGAGPHAGHSIEYNYFNKPTSIEDDNGKTLFNYGADLSRYMQVRYDNGVKGQTTYYVNGGRVEKRYSPSGNVLEQVTYIGDFAQLTEYGTLEAYANNTQSQTWNYLHRDHLGSIEAITDENGAIAVSDGKPQYFSYDAFGQPRTELGDISTRGYTDHEHLAESGLIHMNGRVYDPLISRFLSADIIVQAPEFSQSYNRYSYVWNNPLSLFDPSGYVVQAGLIFTPEVIGFFSGIGLSYNLDFEINDTGGFRGGILDNPIQDFLAPPYIYVPHEGETYSIFSTPIVAAIAVAYIRYSTALDQFFNPNPEGFQAADNTVPIALISEGRDGTSDVDKLREGRDIRVRDVTEARNILDSMPELKPGPGNITPGMRDRRNTYRGDLINTTDPESQRIHDRGQHADEPHFNLDIRDKNGVRHKPAIFFNY